MTAVQDRLRDNHCYGCGADNNKGLQIKSHWQGDESVCRYTPRPEQCAGPTRFVYGGTIASVIDCHSVGTALSNYYRLEGREVGEGAEIWCVTGRLTVSYLEPTPIDQEIVLRATIEDCGEKKTQVKCRVFSGDRQTAEGDVIAIRVPESWRDGA
ncbi:MAG: PaaI family thioesterase [Gammaproteobacteria bacterium]|nr:PaaI family thioesterase [Gammaproteobacteria bacterium]